MTTKRIETYSLYEFCQEVQESILDGFKFDFESNENFPTAFGSMLTCGLVKAVEVEVEVEAKVEETPAPTPTDEVPSTPVEPVEATKGKRGPKAK